MFNQRDHNIARSLVMHRLGDIPPAVADLFDIDHAALGLRHNNPTLIAYIRDYFNPATPIDSPGPAACRYDDHSGA